VEQLSFLNYEKTNMVSKYRLTLVREESFPYNSQLNMPKKVVDFLRNELKLHQEPEEVFIVICVSTQLYPVAVFEAARGTLKEAIVTLKDVLKRIILANCDGFFIAHNHPAGSNSPSTNDIRTTEKFAEAAKLLNYRFHDHIIIAEDSYYSFSENGLLPKGS